MMLQITFKLFDALAFDKYLKLRLQAIPNLPIERAHLRSRAVRRAAKVACFMRARSLNL